MNHEIEKGLKEALERKNPPSGFADRVMARLPQAQAPAGNLRTMPAPASRATSQPDSRTALQPDTATTAPAPHRRPWLAIALAASLAVGSFAGLRYQQYRQGEEARRQLLLALQITGEKLTLAQHIVVGMSEKRGEQ